MSASQDIITGSVAGTGAAINISLGFIPSYVKVFNPSDAGSLWGTIEWFSGMAAASGLKSLKTIDSGVTGLASQAYVTTNGISSYAGTATAGAGFTIGADADINASTEVVYYIAVR